MKRLAIVAAAVVVAVALFVLVVHTPPVRRMVLRYVVNEVQRRYAIQVQADRLDYNLAALTLGLANVRIATDRTPTLPFLEAGYVNVALASRALGGAVAFEEIAVTNGHVRVRRDRDGRMNLPEASETPGGEPAPLDIGRDHGKVELNAPATLRVGKRQTRLSALDGGVSFDGRALKLNAVSLRADEASLRLDGALALLVRDASMDLHATGTADVERLARWGIENGTLPRGSVALDVRASGLLAMLAADIQVTTPRLDWQAVRLTDVAVKSHVTADAADLQSADLAFAGGHVTAMGKIPFGAGDAHVTATWRGIDASTLTSLAGKVDPAPSGTVSGEANLAGPPAEMSKWAATVVVHADGGSTGRGRIAIPGDTRLQLGDGRWRIEAHHTAGGGVPLALVAGGEVDATSIQKSTLAGRLDIADVNIPRLLQLLRTIGIADVNQDLVSGGTMSAVAMLGGRIAAPTLNADIRAVDLAGSQFTIGELRAMAAGDVSTPNISFTADAPSAVVADQQLAGVQFAGQLRGNALRVDTFTASQAVNTGRLSISGTYDLRSETYDASIGLSRWKVTPTTDRPLTVQLDATFAGSGTVDAPRGMGSLRATGVEWNGTSPGDLVADVQLDGTAANIDARAPSLNSRLTARVNMHEPYQATADFRGDNIDLEKLVPRSASPTPLTGHVTVTAHTDTPLSSWKSATARVDITALDGAAGELPIRLSEPARLMFDAERLQVQRFELAVGSGTRLSASGELPLANGSGNLGLTGEGDLGEAVRAIAAAGLADLPIADASGRLLSRAIVTGSLEKPVLTADLSVGPGQLTVKDRSTATELELQAHLENDVVELRKAHTVYEGARLDATGAIPLAVVSSSPAIVAGPSAGKPASLHATVTGITPAVLQGVLAPTAIEDLSGTVDLAVNVESPSTDLAKATGDLTLTRLELQMAGLPVIQRVPTRIVATDGFARIESWNWSGQGATLGVFGQVRLADRQAAIIANGDIDLRMLTPFLRTSGVSTAGRLTPRISVTGPLDMPRVDGDVALEDGEVRLVDPRIVINGLTARAALTRTDLTLRELNGSINGGSLTGTGTVAYRPEAGINAHLSTDIRDMALDFPVGLRSEIDAMLQLDAEAQPGDAAPAGRLSGTVTIQRGAYREPLAVVGGLLAALRARRAAEEAAAASPEASAFLQRLALDIRLQTDDDLIVDNNYARAQLGADLNIIGTAAVPALSGRALLRDEGQLFVGRNVYSISRDAPSTIDFVSPVTIEPELNIHLTTRAGGHDIELSLTGPAEAPQVDMQSEDLGQADITALLLTGRTLDQLGTADASFVGTQVLGNFSGEVLGFAGRAVGLDTLRLGGVEDETIRLDPTAIASAVDPTSRLTFGKNFGPEVDVAFSQSLRNSAAQTWILEYLPARQLDLRFVQDDDDLRSYGFRHDVSFGGGTSGRTAAAPRERREESRVDQVNVSGDLGFPEERIRSLLKLKSRDTFDFGRWQDDRDRLEDFYHRNGHLAARVTASRATNGAVVNLTYAIDAGPQTTIEIGGADVGTDVLQQLADAWASSVLDDLLSDIATQIVRAALAQRGYIQPAVTARVTTQGTTKTLRIEITPGNSGTSTRVRIDTDDRQVADDLNARVAERGLDEQAIRDPGAVARDLTEYLRSRGYLRASVKAGAPLLDKGVAILPIAVDAGPRFVVATVKFEGGGNLPEYDVAQAAAIPVASPYDPAVIDMARQRIVALYRSRGFAAAGVTANAAVREGQPQVDLTFEIVATSRQTVGEVVVTGNGGIDTDVVTRALDLAAGAALEPTELVRARARVFSTGLFRRVDVTSAPMPRAGAAGPDQPMRIVVALEPWPALRLRYGFQATEQYSSPDLTSRTVVPGLLADVTRRTVFGKALSLSGSVQYLRRENSARGVLTAPTLLAWPVQSSLVLERVHHSIEGTTSVSNRNTVSWQQETLLANHLTLSYSYRFDRDHTFDTRPLGTGFDFDITVNVARLIGNVAWDTRDDPLNATRGALYSGSLQWAPDSLGSQFRFLKYVGQAYRFQSVHGVVLASAARLGLVGPLGGQELLLSERFFAGGSRTVRGVDENSLGPRDIFGDPGGGAAMLVFNQEARMPIYKWLGGVVFIDAGNVYAERRDLGLRGLDGAVGFGFRLSTPFALLRADYGRVMWPGSVAGSGRWVFGIGQSF